MTTRNQARSALAIVCFFFGASAHADHTSNEELLGECREGIHSTVASMVKYSQCLAFLDGVTSTFELVEDVMGSEAAGKPYCTAEGVTLGQIARIFVQWAEANPKHLHLRASSGAVMSLMAAFPCEQPVAAPEKGKTL